MTTQDAKGKLISDLRTHVGGYWHWNSEQKLYFMEATPALRNQAAALLESGYDKLPETDGEPPNLCLTEEQAQAAVEKAQDQRFGIWNKPSILASILAEKFGKDWNLEASEARNNRIPNMLRQLTGCSWETCDSHDKSVGLRRTFQPSVGDPAVKNILISWLLCGTPAREGMTTTLTEREANDALVDWSNKLGKAKGAHKQRFMHVMQDFTDLPWSNYEAPDPDSPDQNTTFLKTNVSDLDKIARLEKIFGIELKKKTGDEGTQELSITLEEAKRRVVFIADNISQGLGR